MAAERIEGTQLSLVDKKDYEIPQKPPETYEEADMFLRTPGVVKAKTEHEGDSDILKVTCKAHSGDTQEERSSSYRYEIPLQCETEKQKIWIKAAREIWHWKKTVESDGEVE